MTGEDRTTPRPDLYGPLDVEAFCAAMGIPIETYLEVAAAVAEKFPSTADAGFIDVAELTRLRAIEETARNCSGSPAHFGGCGCTCHAALEGAPHE